MTQSSRAKAVRRRMILRRRMAARVSFRFFLLSRRLGLPEDVIAAAQEQMSGESVRFEDILTQLEEKRQALEKREQEADRLLRQREEDARRAREFREQMERAKENARSRGIAAR